MCAHNIRRYHLNYMMVHLVAAIWMPILWYALREEETANCWNYHFYGTYLVDVCWDHKKLNQSGISINVWPSCELLLLKNYAWCENEIACFISLKYLLLHTSMNKNILYMQIFTCIYVYPLFVTELIPHF